MPVQADGTTIANQKMATDVLAFYVQMVEDVLRAGGADFTTVEHFITEKSYDPETVGSAPPGAVILSAVLILARYGVAAGRSMARDLLSAGGISNHEIRLLIDYTALAEHALRDGRRDFSQLQKAIDDNTHMDAMLGTPPTAIILLAARTLAEMGRARGRSMAVDIADQKRWIGGGANRLQAWKPN